MGNVVDTNVTSFGENFAAISSANCCKDLQVHAFAQESHAPVTKGAVGTARVFAANVIFKRRRLVDAKCLIENVPPVDPLAFWPAGVFCHDQRLRSSIRDFVDAHCRIDQHDSFGRAVSPGDALSKDSSVVAGASTINSRRLSDATWAQIDRKDSRRGARVDVCIKCFVQIKLFVQVLLFKKGQQKCTPCQLTSALISARIRPPFHGSNRKLAQRRMVILQCQTDLFFVVGTSDSTRGFAHHLNRRQR